jgi:hypothetical protein
MITMRTASADRRIARKAQSTDKQAAVAAILASLPADLGRERILGSAASAAFWGVSLPQWRRLYRAKKVPPPTEVGERKLGWRVAVLIDGLKARERTTSDA